MMIALSFNGSRSRAKWGGFSFKWYAELVGDRQILSALQLTLIIAVVATVVATVLGTLAAIGIHAMKKRPAALIMNISYLPMTTPDIVTGVSLMLMFVFIKLPLGFWTMLIAHIAFDTPYVLYSVMPKLKQMNVNLYEAALDLGCTPLKAVWKVIVPQIMPGVVTGGAVSFTMSLDDFVISYFTGGSTDKNLSMVIYSAARRGIEPLHLRPVHHHVLGGAGALIVINKRSSLENVA